MKRIKILMLLLLLSCSSHAQLLIATPEGDGIVLAILAAAAVANAADQQVADAFGSEISVSINTLEDIPTPFINGNIAEYLFIPAPGAIIGGGNTISGASSFGSGSITIQDDVTTSTGLFVGDSVSIAYNNGTFSVGGLTLESISFSLLDPSGTAFDGINPNVLIGLTEADFSGAFFTLFAKDSSFNSFITTGSITSFNVQPIPIPAALWLFITALIGMISFRSSNVQGIN